jgi:excisionase family DNA binding protein
MNKICIVQRRKKSFQELKREADVTIERTIKEEPDFTDRHLSWFGAGVFARNNDDYPHDGFSGDKENLISLALTSEQCRSVHGSNLLRYLGDTGSNDVSMEIQKREEEQIVLNFHFNRSAAVKLLSPDDVCEMLKISRSFLSKLVRTKEIKSHKLGRLRRFMVDEILEYLSTNSDLSGFHG